MPISNRITIRDIAARLGVSHVTVSLALRHNSRISKKRQIQVLKLAEEMGYQPDPMLSSLSVYCQRKRPKAIHSVLAWINCWKHPEDLRKIGEFNAYWTGASEAAERFGYRLEEFAWPEGCTPSRMQRILETRNIRGLLIPPHPSQPEWGNFRWDRFSVIRFGLSVRYPDTYVVTADHHRSVVTAVKNIHDYGYQRIGFVVPGDFDLRLGGGWTGGFLTAQKVLNLPTRLPLLISDGTLKISAFQEKFKRWLEKHQPDAILTTDKRAIETLGLFNLRIPQDIAVAATTVLDIPVDTGINQNSEQIGRVAVETLISLINATDRERPPVSLRILVQGSWVDGTSLPNRNAKITRQVEITRLPHEPAF